MSFVFSHNGGKGAFAFLGFIDLCVGISGGGKGGARRAAAPGVLCRGRHLRGENS